MRKMMLLLTFLGLLAGCSYLKQPEGSTGSRSGSSDSMNAGRGTTGVSTGADMGIGRGATQP